MSDTVKQQAQQAQRAPEAQQVPEESGESQPQQVFRRCRNCRGCLDCWKVEESQVQQCFEGPEAQGASVARQTPRKVHFIGIGGIGMSGIARVAFSQGMQVSGSDLRESRHTKQLRELGITVHIGHHASHVIGSTSSVTALDTSGTAAPEVPGSVTSEVPEVPDTPETSDTPETPGTPEVPDVVVVSTAILENNPELVAAREHGLLIWHRAQMLAELGVGKKTLAVTGTHGKTTSSSLLASVLDAIGCSPSFLVGGIVQGYGTNAHSGEGDYYVVEADESDKSFTYLDPSAMLITNIEADHLDHYENLDEIYSLFKEFMASGDSEGFCVICGEDAALCALAVGLDKKVYRYGFDDADSAAAPFAADSAAVPLGSDVPAGPLFDIGVSGYREHGIGSDFEIRFPDGQRVSTGLANNPGRHNALNAAGVLGVVWALGHPVESAARALRAFKGVKRRFEEVGEVAGITVVDDYAHHPTEIAATLAAAKKLDFKRTVALFQPHRYSRVGLFTEVLREEFCHAFDRADEVVFMNVYAAGEAPVPGVTGKSFADVVRDQDSPPPVRYIPRRVDLIPFLMEELREGDLLITMGAGDVTVVGPQLVEALESASQARS